MYLSPESGHVPGFDLDYIRARESGRLHEAFYATKLQSSDPQAPGKDVYFPVPLAIVAGSMASNYNIHRRSWYVLSNKIILTKM